MFALVAASLYTTLLVAVVCCSYSLITTDWLQFNVIEEADNATHIWRVGLYSYKTCPKDNTMYCKTSSRGGSSNDAWPYSKQYVDTITVICLIVGILCFCLCAIIGGVLLFTRHLHFKYEHCCLHLKVSIPILVWIGACFTPFAPGIFANRYEQYITLDKYRNLFAPDTILETTAQYGFGFYLSIVGGFAYFLAGVLSCVVFSYGSRKE